MIGENQPFKTNALNERLDLNFALQAAGLGVWEMDPITRLINWDERCQDLFGLSNAAVMPYEQIIQHIHPDDREMVSNAIQKAMNPQSGGNYDVTYRTFSTDVLQIRWVNVKGKSYFTQTGEVYRFAGVAQDVTEPLVNQQTLEASEARFRSLIEEAPVATCLFVGPALIIEIANQQMLDIWGKGNSALGQPLVNALPELLDQPYVDILHSIYASGEVYHATEDKCDLIINGQFKTFYFNFTYKPLFTNKGEVYAIMNMAVDVTQQVIVRQEIEDSEAKFRTLIEQAPVATCFYVGPTHKIDLANKLMIDFFGKGDAILGKPISEVLNEDKDKGALSILDQVYTTGMPFDAIAAPAELVIHGVPGTYYFDFSLKPIFNGAGQVYAIIQMAIDVTEQVVAQQALKASEAKYRTLAIDLEQQVQIRTQQLERTVQDLRRSNENLEQFAYIASHDLQEPLRKIQQFGDLLNNQYGSLLGKEINYLARMQAAASRMSILIRDLLSFSKINTGQVMTHLVSLDDVITNTLTDLELVVAESGATISVDPMPMVLGDASQLGQLFGNLLSNALKFRRKDIVPLIRILHQKISANELPATVHITRSADYYHRIDIADNGIGFDMKYLDRMFQVFQRLHSQGEYAGTGIGLAICEKVASNHGGGITASSQVGQGAVFSIFLPV